MRKVGAHLSLIQLKYFATDAVFETMLLSLHWIGLRVTNMQGPDLAKDFDPDNLPDSFYIDPYPTYEALRTYDPVHENPDGSYFLTRYADLDRVYRSADTSSDKKKLFGSWFGESPLLEHHTTSLVFNDAPYHARVRKLIGSALRPPSIRAMEPGLTHLVDGLLDDIEQKSSFDLLWNFSSLIPLELICNLLGVPSIDRAPISGWSMAILGALEANAAAPELDVGNRSVSEFSDYLDGLIDDRRVNPGDPEIDLLTRLILAEEDGDRLSHRELIQNCIFLLNAGHETTGSLIANGVHELLINPYQMSLLREDPTLIRTAVDEMLRYQSSVQLGNRELTAEFDLGEKTLPAGTHVWVCIGAANRDPEKFPDPDRFDIQRKPNQHLAFISGAHTCLGNMLGRTEARIAINALLDRFPKLSLIGEPEYERRARFRRFKSLPLNTNA
jgi:cytochrome P450